jgi:transposase InsO family protein
VSPATTTLAVGTRLWHEGEAHTVVALDGRSLVLRSSRGRQAHVDVPTLLAHPTTRLVAPASAADETSGATLAGLSEVEAAAIRERAAHVLELLTGFRTGSGSTAGPGEPRPEYDPSVPIMARYQAKAVEIGVGERTLQRWVRAYQAFGPAGLADGRGQRRVDPFRGVDQRWIDACRVVIAEHVDASRPTRDLLLRRLEARLVELHGPGAIPLPTTNRAHRMLAELSRGTNAFTGSTKGKRSIANRPSGVYGRLVATRPGEYLLLDTTRLDVFAMESVTLRWVPVELTIALDLYSRCIVGLRLSPVSTKAVDAALVVYEAINPGSRAHTSSGLLPYVGVPTTVVVAAERLAADPDLGLPGVAPETLVLDHGKIYLSEHLLSVCARLGISIQPARPYTPTDKAAVERFFRTVADQLLAALPGYKGSDVYSRGRDVEEQAWFFVGELEAVIREWVATVYHRRPHDGLADPAVPGLDLSPMEMLEHGAARAGRLQVPVRPDLVYDFLPVAWRTIQHYGVEMNGLRYNGEVLAPYRNRRSPFTGAHAGKWPFRFDPDDVSRLFFEDPSDHTWHVLRWEHARDVPLPFSVDALAYARRLAVRRDRYPDVRRALAELLQRWDAGLARNPTERRMALRLSQQRAARLEHERANGTGALADLTAVPTRVAEPSDEAAPSRLGGDDDTAEELDASGPAEEEVVVDDGLYYADAFGSVE